MAGKSKEYELAIKIAGKVASSFNTAFGHAQSTMAKLGGVASTISKATAAALGIATTGPGT